MIVRLLHAAVDRLIARSDRGGTEAQALHLVATVEHDDGVVVRTFRAPDRTCSRVERSVTD